MTVLIIVNMSKTFWSSLIQLILTEQHMYYGLSSRDTYQKDQSHSLLQSNMGPNSEAINFKLKHSSCELGNLNSLR